MFLFESPLFWYRLVFLTELAAAEIMITASLKRRNHFWLRATGSLFVVYVLTFLIPLFSFSYSAWYTSLMFFLIFAMTAAGLLFCFEEKIRNIVFCSLIAYTAQHVAYLLLNFYLVIVSGNTLNVYGDTGSFLDAMGVGAGDAVAMTYINCIVYLLIYSLVYWLIWVLIERRIREQEELELNNTYLLFWSALTIFIDIVLSSIATYSGVRANSTMAFLFYSSNLVSCILALGILSLMLGRSLLASDLKTIQELWRRDKQMYEMSKEKAEFIQIKCHDLKRLIREFSNEKQFFGEDELEEIESAINICGAVIKTGHDALDIILTECSILCENYSIAWSCIADGESLSFMSSSNLYSLFNNALQNAVDAAKEIEPSSERFIRLKVMRVANSVMIQIENSIRTPDSLSFVDGLPVTTKKDMENHGYGLKSARMVVQKYNGDMTVKVRNRVFEFDAVIPIPREGKKESSSHGG
ncbi:MAG: sensor histidine kinase [Lachnospiraceae bacterium]|nr:sensor histidine kinase [Lachnospiraceae bacterium]